nr:F-box domain, leucine-rich repeat domain, L domain-like protein [Tanacetum cinerariifolium]
MYCLPNILSSMSTLKSLKISDCVMLPLSLMVGVVNFKSLKVLWLTRVPLNLPVIKQLSASCPLLEELVVECCYGLTEFCVHGQLQNLKTLRFSDYNENGTETIDIEAPNLCECLLSAFSGISDEERSHFLKCISERLIQQEDQGPTSIRIEWSLPSKAKIYFSWSSMLTASCYEVTQTLSFKKEERS